MAELKKPGLFSPALSLLSVTLALFGRFLDPHTHLILSEGHQDLDTQILWWRQFAFSELRHGHLALWVPNLFCGTPFFGYLQPALLYPPNWFYMVLPLPFAVNFFMALHVFLAGWFTSLWIAKRGSRPLSALLAGLMMMLGAALFLRIVPGHLLNLSAMSWMPLILWAVEGYRQEREPRWILWGVFAVGMQVLSGQMQLFYYTVLFVGAAALFSLPAKQKISFLAGAFLMGLGGLLIGAVQVLTGWDAAQESLRGSGMTMAVAGSTPMIPERLWCLLLPDFFGDWKNYWGGGLYWEGVTYVSLTAFVLALYGLKVSDQPQKKFFGGAFLFLVLLALGNRTFLFALFYHWVPFFNHFRGVAKVDILITLCLAALAALGLDEILEKGQGLGSLAKATGIGSLLVFLTALVFELVVKIHPQRFGKFLSQAGPMMESLVICGGLLALLAGLAWMGWKNPIWRYGFFVLAFLELFIFAWDNRPFFDYQALEQKVDPIRQVYASDPGDYRILADSRNYALGTGGLDIWGYDTNIPSRYARFIALTQPCSTDDFLKDSTLRHTSSAMGLVRLRYVFQDDGTKLVPTRLHLKEAPRFFFTDHWEIKTTEEALEKEVQPGFDPFREAFLESDPGISMEKGKLKSQIRFKDLSSDAVQIDVTNSKPAILVMTDNYSRGWKAAALEAQAQSPYSVVPVDGFLRAVPLSAGEHHFLLEYRPTAFVVGKWISIVSVMIYLLLIIWIVGFRKGSGLWEAKDF